MQVARRSVTRRLGWNTPAEYAATLKRQRVQAEAYHDAPRPIIEAASWAHARRKFFVLADITTKARGKLLVILRR